MTAAPDAEAIMALADHYAEHREFRGEERSYPERNALRAAVERVCQQAVGWKWLCDQRKQDWQKEKERAERAEAERDTLKAACEELLVLTGNERLERAEVLSKDWEYACNRYMARAERAEAERDDLALELHEERANSGRVHEALSRAEAERDALKALLQECRDGEQCLGVNDDLIAHIDAYFRKESEA